MLLFKEAKYHAKVENTEPGLQRQKCLDSFVRAKTLAPGNGSLHCSGMFMTRMRGRVLVERLHMHVECRCVMYNV